MTYMQKYLFDTSFDPEDMRREEDARRRAREAAAKAEAEARANAKTAGEAKPAEPTFGKADLEAAESKGYAAGEDAGRAAALNGIQQTLGEALASVARQLGPLIERQRLDQETTVEQSVQLALAITRKVLPELARRKGLAEIEALVRDCLKDMSEEPRIVIRVSDDMLDLVRARIEPLGESLGFPGSIVLLAEPSFGPADCRVEWADGGAERLAAQVWQDIETAVGRFLEYPQSVIPTGPLAGARTQSGRPAAAVTETGAEDEAPWPGMPETAPASRTGANPATDAQWDGATPSAQSDNPQENQE